MTSLENPSFQGYRAGVMAFVGLWPADSRRIKATLRTSLANNPLR
jgi:hypothetical protein